MTPRNFAILYCRHYDNLHQFILSRSRNADLAEDIVSRAFVTAWDKESEHTGHFKAWLYRIAYRILCQHWRKENHWQRVDLETLCLPSAENLEREYALREEYAGVIALCEELSRDHQRALAHQVADISVEESALRLGVPVGTILSRRFIARETVRDLCRS